MKSLQRITGCFLILFFVFASATVVADSVLDRAGKENWYQWKNEKGKKNGYSHEKYTKIRHNGKPALKTVSTLHHANGKTVNDITLTLISNDLEPMVKMTVVASEKEKENEFKTSMSAKPGKDGYIFAIDRNGKKETRMVPRSGFDYFDFEDHYLYSAKFEGEPRVFRVLNSFTLGIESRTIQCKGDETVKILGKKIKCLKYICLTKDFKTTIWKEKKSGTIVKQTFPNGASIQLVEKEKAKSF